jgi:hypothetical protein
MSSVWRTHAMPLSTHKCTNGSKSGLIFRSSLKTRPCCDRDPVASGAGKSRGLSSGWSYFRPLANVCHASAGTLRVKPWRSVVSRTRITPGLLAASTQDPFSPLNDDLRQSIVSPPS